MARDDKRTLHHDFAFATEAELNQQIRALASVHEAAQGEILAMDARRPLGAGKVRVTFRVVEKKGGGKGRR